MIISLLPYFYTPSRSCGARESQLHSITLFDKMLSFGIIRYSHISHKIVVLWVVDYTTAGGLSGEKIISFGRQRLTHTAESPATKVCTQVNEDDYRMSNLEFSRAVAVD